MSGPGPGLSPSVGRQVLKGGTSVSWRWHCFVPLVRVGSFWGLAVERGRGGVGCLARCWVLRDRAQALSSGHGPPGWGVWLCGALTPVEPLPLFWWGGRRPMVVGGRPFLENYTVDASIFVAQVFKGTRWMPWHQEPMKDVGICDKPRGVDNQTVIRGFPNGETRLEASPVTLA